MKERIVFGFLLIFLLSFVSAASTTSTFDLNSLIIKASVTQGDSVTKVLTLSKGIGQDVKLEAVNLDGVSLSDSDFVLGLEAKNVLVVFNTKDLKPGVYVGSIKISDSKNSFSLPVILEVESKDIFYDANLEVSPQYSVIAPGEKLVVQLKIFDLTNGGTNAGLGTNNVNVEYAVHGVDGKTIVSESESVVVDKQTQLSKVISFPSTSEKGDYVFSVVVKYKSSVGVSSYLFTVGSQSTSSFLSKIDFSNWQFYIIALVILVIFVVFILFFVFIVKDRDKMFLEMREDMERDYRKNLDLIRRQETALRAKGIPEKVIKKEKENKIKKLEVKHIQEKKNVEKLKHSGDKKSMEKQLLEWKKRGFNTEGMEYKLSGLSTDEMKKIIKEWKEHYR